VAAALEPYEENHMKRFVLARNLVSAHEAPRAAGP
jgi:hypothetical protein